MYISGWKHFVTELLTFWKSGQNYIYLLPNMTSVKEKTCSFFSEGDFSILKPINGNTWIIIKKGFIKIVLDIFFSGPKLHDTMPLLKITTVQSILCHYWLYYIIIILAVNSKKSTKVSDVSTCRERGRLFIQYDAKNSNLCLDQKCNFYDLGPNCNFCLNRGSIF
jgi:hypothetical protein